MNLLVILHPGFNDTELVTTINVLKRSGQFDKITFYNSNLKVATGQANFFEINLVNKINLEDYDAIFVPGGSGAKLFRKDPEAIKTAKWFMANNKFVFAICDAPNALYESGIIPADYKYSSFPIENIMNISSKNRNQNNVTIDRNLITGRCAGASKEFALTILKQLFGNKTYQIMKNSYDPEE